MRLLEHGYSVNTTVRPDPEHKRDTNFLTSLTGASQRLQIFDADLSDPCSFEAAIEGCIGVFHVATPVDFGKNEAEEVVTKRAIDGTLGILKACLKFKTVKRVVYTSSASAVALNGKDLDLMDESFWSDVDFIRSMKSFLGPYMISKTLTEKAALQFAKEHGLDLVTLIPSFVIGPFICPKFPSSVNATLAMILGNQEVYSLMLNTSMVHVDDVARAHIFLLEYPDAKGRYICSSDTITLEQMSEYLSTKYPEYAIPTIESLKEIKGVKAPGLSSKKLLDSGFRYKYGLDEMFDGAIQCCKEKGYL
ncbi:Epimerase domain-containing protein [Cephalotus follicularis]|uniref:Epimerase domain-containing protein n=1 Tax=Cephalotus follicularis TaxID=3775 RepID=A0A1Q3AX57_CEPFO|nr:Epimerase domain-containing protein [Cephalotus follicularis]